MCWLDQKSVISWVLYIEYEIFLKIDLIIG